jgi:L-iditol 2-dehydrogenase
VGSRKMKAAVCYAPGDIRLEQVPVGELAADEVLVRVAFCGICPSDFRVYDGRSSHKLPMILGHEFSGWVEEIGPGVTRFGVGEPVVVDPADKCYTQCPPCLRGLTNKCTGVQVGGGGDGFAEYRVAKEARVYRLRPTTDLVAASLAEPLACVMHGQHRTGVGLGSVVVVVGSGPIGLLHVTAAKSAGAKVIASEVQPARLAVAAELGADVTVDPTKQDLAEVVRQETGGWGANAIIVAVGSKAAIEGAVGSLAPQGTIVLFAGMYPNVPISLDPNFIHYSEINVTGSSDYTDQDFFEAVTFIEDGTIDTRALVSDILPLERVVEGMEIVRSARKLKVVIQANQP